jgi:hypothetical protein
MFTFAIISPSFALSCDFTTWSDGDDDNPTEYSIEIYVNS